MTSGPDRDSDLGACCFVLGIDGLIDELKVRTAYRRLMLIWHPDKHHGNPAAATEAGRRAIELNRAHECLTEHLESDGPFELAAVASNSDRRSGACPRQPRHVYRRQPFRPGFPDGTVFEVFVKSSNILSVGYSQRDSILYIKFHDGSVYRYFGVERAMLDELLSAGSLGAFAHRRIYSRYRYERCPP